MNVANISALDHLATALLIGDLHRGKERSAEAQAVYDRSVENGGFTLVIPPQEPAKPLSLSTFATLCPAIRLDPPTLRKPPSAKDLA